ncbi:MAG: hypothetical protein AABY22_34740, partial [Nanoarchaeota archaeon]
KIDSSPDLIRMGFWSKKNEKSKCTTTPDGIFKCESYREAKDGTRIDTANFTLQPDANCNLVMLESFEAEEGALDRLEKAWVHKIKAKCSTSNKPADY